MKRMRLIGYQKGLSLVELMISIFISVIVLSGVVSVVQTSNSTFFDEQESSFIQENLRYAVETISRDIRLAGSFGCADVDNVHLADVLVTDSTGLYSMDPIDGYEGSTSLSGFPTTLSLANAGSDALILRYADPDKFGYVRQHDKAADRLILHNPSDFEAQDKVIIVDPTCRHMGIFSLSNVNTTGKRLRHLASTSNCSNEIFADASFDCSTPGTSTNSYQGGAVVMEYRANAYFIDDSTVIAGLPALKRRVLDGNGSRVEELAQGVESMELLYGVDLDDDGDVNRYVDADDVTDWEEIVAVRFALIFRSQNEVYDADQTVTLNGTDYTDKFLRQIASATVRLRNR